MPSVRDGSLLRLFKSEYFDAHLHMTYLLVMDQRGVQDYLVNALYNMTDEDVDFYLPQLCQISLQRYSHSPLHRFLLDKVQKSMHFALKVSWYYQSMVEDHLPDLVDSAVSMVAACEGTVATSAQITNVDDTGSRLPPDSGHTRSRSCPALGKLPGEESLPERARRRSNPQCTSVPSSGAMHDGPPGLTLGETMRHLVFLSASCSHDERAQVHGLAPHLPNAFVELGDAVCADAMGFVGQARMSKLGQQCDFYNTQKCFVTMVAKLSTTLAAQEKSERKVHLYSTLRLLNQWLLERRVYNFLRRPLSFSGLQVPMLRSLEDRSQIVRVHVDQCRVFSSATRAPFLIVFECANLDEEHEGAGHRERETRVDEPLVAALSKELGMANEDSVLNGKAELLRQLMRLGPKQWQALGAETCDSPEPDDTVAECGHEGLEAQQSDGGADCAEPSPSERAVKLRQDIWGERWEARKQRIRDTSPYSLFPSWTVTAVVAKGGDDVRQELVAAQMIRQFHEIFEEAKLPLWLRQMEVLVINSQSGFIECINDATSVDAMKRQFPGQTLAEIFRVAFADRLFEAKQNFIESIAAYSLVVWFLQVKDRHNGNLMMDADGHVVHIDFGFMLSNSPGKNMAFEQSPFKLTQEFLDVMDGECSEQYEYFRTLVIRGFLEARKQMDRIILPIRMLLSGSRLPCFREGSASVLQGLQERFFSHLSEDACIDKVVDLIDVSVNNWRTVQYDNYQRIVNGIL